MASLCATLGAQADRVPERVGWIIGERKWTYGELAEMVERVAAGLRAAGLSRGDRLTLLLPNCPEYLVAYFGAMRAGLIVSPVNVALTPPEIGHLLADAGSSVIVTNADLLAPIRDLTRDLGIREIVTDAGDIPTGMAFGELAAASTAAPDLPDEQWPACLPYSSGTTGRPKGIVHTHATLAAQAVLSANHLQMRGTDVVAQALPLFHLYGGNIILGGVLVAGGTLVVQPAFEPRAMVGLLERHGAAAYAGVPTSLTMLAALPERVVGGHDLRALEVAYCAGAPLPERTRREFARRFSAVVLDCYGITEAGGNLTGSLRYDEAPELTCGVPYPRTEIRIVDDESREVALGEIGELTARGPQIMVGYWNQPDATAAALRDGWLHTGDLARRDENGYCYIVDRKNDLVISGGNNIYPAEVENVLQSHPAVAMCLVFGVAHEILGEQPHAAVVLRAGSDASPADLDRHCRERLAAYKVPRHFHFVDDLPRSSVGKLLRREMRDRYAAVS